MFCVSIRWDGSACWDEEVYSTFWLIVFLNVGLLDTKSSRCHYRSAIWVFCVSIRWDGSSGCAVIFSPSGLGWGTYRAQVRGLRNESGAPLLLVWNVSWVHILCINQSTREGKLKKTTPHHTSILETQTATHPCGGGGEGAYSSVACVCHLIIDHASHSRRSMVGGGGYTKTKFEKFFFFVNSSLNPTLPLVCFPLRTYATSWSVVSFCRFVWQRSTSHHNRGGRGNDIGNSYYIVSENHHFIS